MAILLGVDTGGTYTDAILLRDEEEVLSSAKSLTTRHNLAQGVGNAIQAVLDESGVNSSDIAMASLSTTLATNALVEGQGGRVALVFIGFSEKDLARQNLEDALKGDPAILIAGGHNHAGGEAKPLDIDTLKAALKDHDVSAYAVASQFATRNPAHEITVRDFIRDTTGKPVSCSHELSSKLGGPKRAMTAVLNARLIGMIDHLISDSENMLRTKGIIAPMMVVRGDGALISANQARVSPIETILSGPAASIVGARWLTDEQDALVSDIGGTTTDVAVLRNGRPMIDPDGARVGDFRTMVEAVAMRTTGLGGDSQVHMAKDGLAGDLSLGPRRSMPISLCALSWPDLVHDILDKQLQTERAGEFDGQFVVPIKRLDVSTAGLPERDQKLLAKIGDKAHALGNILSSRLDLTALQRLVSRGLVILSSVTPSDASHVLGRLDAWDSDAALKAVTLFGRQRNGAGDRLCADAQIMAQKIVDQLTEQTALTLLETAYAEDGFDPALARHLLTKSGLDHHRGILALDTGLNLPIIGLGASAPSYYGAVGERLKTKPILPKHAGVANALGAVVGQISMRVSGQITSPSESKYRVHFVTGPEDFTDSDKAMHVLESHLSEIAKSDAEDAGSQDIRITIDRDIKTSTIEGREVFIEATLTATATGRPRIADG